METYWPFEEGKWHPLWYNHVTNKIYGRLASRPKRQTKPGKNVSLILLCNIKKLGVQDFGKLDNFPDFFLIKSLFGSYRMKVIEP